MIKRFLKWALSKFEDKPTLEDKLKAWPFPAVSEDFEPRPKAKPAVKKTRALPSKASVAKKAIKKKAK